jgi:hypothetical protein
MAGHAAAVASAERPAARRDVTHWHGLAPAAAIIDYLSACPTAHRLYADASLVAAD